MEQVMRVLWHLNTELGCVYETKTLAQSLTKEADAEREAFTRLLPDSEEAQFAAGELEGAIQSIKETEAALRALIKSLEALMPKGGERI